MFYYAPKWATEPLAHHKKKFSRGRAEGSFPIDL